jgi:hypothetical protein
MIKANEWFIKLQEQDIKMNDGEHVMFYTLNNEQECDDRVII